MHGIIYKVTNEKTGKVYIGQTTYTLAKRKKGHKYQAMKGDKRSAFQIAILEHGISAFSWDEIDKADSKEELNAKEKYWVAFYKARDPQFGYNLTEGGVDAKPSEETRRKLSEVRKNMSAETRRKMSEARKGKPTWNKGKKLSPEQKKNFCGRKPRPSSKETNKKISEANYGKHGSLTTDEVKEIKRLLSSGKTQTEIAKMYNVVRDTIGKIKRGERYAWVV